MAPPKDFNADVIEADFNADVIGAESPKRCPICDKQLICEGKKDENHERFCKGKGKKKGGWVNKKGGKGKKAKEEGKKGKDVNEV
ncbi:hypothetical protein CASFOL_016206 [Castilleja foliolosa]|uniref:Uncharacterized protein n=1 Tax=Castilleja foliolosa TaxID=1961234 RepID=A0ABD3DGJ4_9LAMI